VGHEKEAADLRKQVRNAERKVTALHGDLERIRSVCSVVNRSIDADSQHDRISFVDLKNLFSVIETVAFESEMLLKLS
jgi:hypothetical protein